jgi:hypothetical protein
MNDSLTYGSHGAATRDRTRTLFGQTMGYVALTAGFVALGAYLGRHLSQTMVDFQRLRRNTDLDCAPLLAASIFLDALNVFLSFLRIFSRGEN